MLPLFVVGEGTTLVPLVGVLFTALVLSTLLSYCYPLGSYFFAPGLLIVFGSGLTSVC